MRSSVACFVATTAFVLCLWGSSASIAIQYNGPGTPSHGDLILGDKNVVLVYLGADYIYNNTHWATIDNKEQDQDSSKVLCQQFGYTSTSCLQHSVSSDSTSYRGMKSITITECNSTDGHILRCVHTISGDNSNIKEYTSLKIPSDNHKRIVYSAGYNNEVMLWSPDPPTNSSGYFSPSYGVVVIHDTKNWKYIDSSNSNGLLSDNVADTICRQMGYTHSVPNSMMFLNESEVIFNFNYSDFRRHIGYSELTMKCQKPYSCIRCCEFPTVLSPNQYENSATFLKCTFYDMESPPESGSQEMCGSDAVCQDGGGDQGSITLKKESFYSAIFVPSGVLMIGFIVTSLIAIHYKKKYRKGYILLQRNGRLNVGINRGEPNEGPNGGPNEASVGRQ